MKTTSVPKLQNRPLQNRLRHFRLREITFPASPAGKTKINRAGSKVWWSLFLSIVLVIKRKKVSCREFYHKEIPKYSAQQWHPSPHPLYDYLHRQCSTLPALQIMERCYLLVPCMHALRRAWLFILFLLRKHPRGIFNFFFWLLLFNPTCWSHQDFPLGSNVTKHQLPSIN